MHGRGKFTTTVVAYHRGPALSVRLPVRDVVGCSTMQRNNCEAEAKLPAAGVDFLGVAFGTTVSYF